MKVKGYCAEGEEKQRANKALNILVRGMDIGDTPMADAQFLVTKMSVNLSCDSAWRIGKMELSQRPLAIKFRTAADRVTLMSMKGSLKGTKM